MPRTASHGDHRANAERNRERILDVASRLMGERGFAATTISSVCKEASVVAPTVYWHFGDKQGLAVAVMERAAERWFDRFIPEAGVSIEEQPEVAGSLFYERPEFLRLLLMLSLERRDPDDGVRIAAESIRKRGCESQLPRLERRLGAIEDPVARREAAGLIAEYVIAQLDGIFVASQLGAEVSSIEGMTRLMPVAVNAAIEHAIQEARESGTASSVSAPTPGR